jgi:hypothetical protein
VSLCWVGSGSSLVEIITAPLSFDVRLLGEETVTIEYMTGSVDNQERVM